MCPVTCVCYAGLCPALFCRSGKKISKSSVLILMIFQHYPECILCNLKKKKSACKLSNSISNFKVALATKFLIINQRVPASQLFPVTEEKKKKKKKSMFIFKRGNKL